MADVIFGSYAPSGRLPFSIPVGAEQLGSIEDYSMQSGYGRTYRYNRYSNASAAPMFPFAFGLGFANLSTSIDLPGAPTTVTAPLN